MKSIFYNELIVLQDTDYKEFNDKLIPTVDGEKTIGIRIPALRKLAKTLWKNNREDCLLFMKQLPHTYFEENNLHVFFIECETDLIKSLEATELFLPYIDNWATCDVFSPPIFKKHKGEVLLYIKKWIKSEECYIRRYAIGLLLSNYLDDDFEKSYLNLVAEAFSKDYYVNMMRAWYFATALAKQPAVTLSFITDYKLDPWTHNKTIQKARESRRISKKIKEQLLNYKLNDIISLKAPI